MFNIYFRSVVGIIDESGGSLVSFAYDPFGNLVMQSGSSESLFMFSGQFGVLKMEESGLHFMRTRFYNSQLGRFMSPDQFGVFGSASNFYVYASNNPLKYVDPLGTIPAPLVSGLISLGVYFTANLLTGSEITVGGAVGSFAGGVVTGFFPAAGLTKLQKFGVGALGGVVGNTITQLIDNDNLADFSFLDTFISAVTSGVLNAVFPGKNFASNIAKNIKKIGEVAAKFGMYMQIVFSVYKYK